MKTHIALAALALSTAPLGACVAVPDAPNVVGTPAPAETPVPLLQPVMVGDLAVTPMKVVEDSRCPMNARCVWAGRVIVETRIDGDGWRETKNITLGETFGTHDRMIALVAVTPEKTTDHEIEPGEYRFVYERRDNRFS